MVVIGLIVVFAALFFLAWLMFGLAVYALPLFAGITAGTAAYHHDAGVAGAIVVGFLAAGACLAIGQIAFAMSSTILARGIIALVYAVPAGLAGNSAALGLSHIFIASNAWCEAFGMLGAILVGGAAVLRMAELAGPLPEAEAAKAAQDAPAETRGLAAAGHG